MIVQAGILSPIEVQYVSWANLKINAADFYWNAKFTVAKDGAKVFDNDTINASTGETPAQIAAKYTTKIFFKTFWELVSRERPGPKYFADSE